MTTIQQSAQMQQNAQWLKRQRGTFTHACGVTFHQYAGGENSYLDHRCHTLDEKDLTYAGQARVLARKVRIHISRVTLEWDGRTR